MIWLNILSKRDCKQNLLDYSSIRKLKKIQMTQFVGVEILKAESASCRIVNVFFSCSTKEMQNDLQNIQ